MQMAIDAREAGRIAAQQATERQIKLEAMRATEGKNPRWHVVHSAAESDKHVLDWLGPEHFAYDLYYPRVRELRPKPKRQQSQKERRSRFQVMREVLVPFFPRYFFVRFDPAGSLWREHFKFAGVGGMLCHGGHPAPLDERIIDLIRGREVGGAIPGVIPVHQLFRFQVGDKVRINDGPFDGFDGTIDKFMGTDVDTQTGNPIGRLDAMVRIVVLSSLFGRRTPVELEINQIEAA